MTIDSGVLYVGVTPARINGIKSEPTIIEAWIRRFVFRNNDNGRATNCDRGILIRRLLNAPRYHQTNMDVITHVVRNKRLKKSVRQCIAGDTHIEV